MKLTLSQFNDRYPDSNACLEEVKRLRYPTFQCRRCGAWDRLHRLPHTPAYHCVCGDHLHPLVGTIFENSRIELRHWFFIMWLMTTTKSGIAGKEVERMTGLSYKTVHRLMHKIRSIMDHGELLSGDVEVDETFFRPKPMRDSRIVKGRPPDIVMGMVQRDGHAKVMVVDDTSRTELEGIIKRWVSEGATIHSDGAPAYALLDRQGYDHRPVSHWRTTKNNQIRFAPSAAMGTQNVENLWGHMKRGIYGVYRHVDKAYLQNYVDEYAWRYSNRNSEVPMFDILLERACRKA